LTSKGIRGFAPHARGVRRMPDESILKKSMYYVYILVSRKDENFYVGFSDDLKRRIDEHKKGKVKSTKYRLPLELVCYEAYIHKEEAMTREKYLKSSDGKKDLRKRLTKTLNIKK